MAITAGLSARVAVQELRNVDPDSYRERINRHTVCSIVQDFVARYGGIPATSLSRSEPAVLYRTMHSNLPVLLGLYGDAVRVCRWLPGYPATVSPLSAAEMAKDSISWEPQPLAADQSTRLSDLPVLVATPRDAGPYITLGLVSVWDEDRDVAISVHRLLVLDDHRLAIWMVPGRNLSRIHQESIRVGRRLPVCINIGAPPAAIVASALATTHLPRKTRKLDLAGALAGAPIGVYEGAAPALAESEIVLFGHLDASTIDETLTNELDGSLPEFLGNDGMGQPSLPVIKIESGLHRQGATYQAVAGPGREQSVILGLASALSSAWSLAGRFGDVIKDIYYPPAGGGMLTAIVCLVKKSSQDDSVPAVLARAIVEGHPFTKMVIVVDEDVDPRNAEDLLWALGTRANLGTDLTVVRDMSPQSFDFSQGGEWNSLRGGAGGRSLIDATVPFLLRAKAARSFESGRES